MSDLKRPDPVAPHRTQVSIFDALACHPAFANPRVSCGGIHKAVLAAPPPVRPRRSMVRREVADRVGRAGVAGQREGLAAAAAEIDLLAARRLRHGSGIQSVPRNRVEGRRFAQISASECSRTDPEFEARDGLGGVAGQDLARRRDVEERRPQPPMQGLGQRA